MDWRNRTVTLPEPQVRSKNEAAEKLRGQIEGWITESGAKAHAVANLSDALAWERRRTVERIREGVGVMRTPAGREIGYIQIGEQQFHAILTESETSDG